MNLAFHKNLNINDWYAKSVSYQLSNVGSEISRTINWQQKDRAEYADLSFERALELLDLTVSDPKNVNRLNEILRLREMLVSWKLQSGSYINDSQSLMKYFDEFAYYARQR